jgi:hypothetical protein
MKTQKTIKVVAITLLAIGMTLAGCKKEFLPNAATLNGDNVNGTEKIIPVGGSLSVKLINTSPMASMYKGVDVDIAKVEVSYKKEGRRVWITVDGNPQTFNLLQLENATMVNGARVPAGTIDKVRVILGAKNSIVMLKNNERAMFPIVLPEIYSSTGVEVNVNEPITNNNSRTITLNFQANASISNEGNGEYIMTPVINDYKILIPTPTDK